MKPVVLFLSVFTIVFSFNITAAQTASLKIINADNKTFVFSEKDLKAFPQTTLHVNAEDGSPHNYSGVDIHILLSNADIEFGKALRKQNLDSYMLVRASDGYSVLYAFAEIDTSFSDKQMIIAILKDGKPLPQGFGPLQLIATGEKVHARLIRMVTEIDIKKAK